MLDPKKNGPEAQTVLDDLLKAARRAGADAADAMYYESRSLSAGVRLGQPEDVESSESRDIGLRVLIGRRQACVSTTDFSPGAIAQVVERAISMARLAPEDKYCGLADPAQLARDQFDPDLLDQTELDMAQLLDRAKACEAAALAVAGVTNSEGGSAARSASLTAYAATNGFSGFGVAGSHSISAVAIAGEDTGMERDWDYAAAPYFTDLPRAEEIGRRAGERAVRRLNPRKLESQAMPIVYENRVANSLLGHFASAINGAAIARGTSFLKSKMGQEIFSPRVDIIDDPLRRRGFRSRWFDLEGVAGKTRKLVDQGRLTTWIMDCATARQLGLESTGHASRGMASPPSPSPSNLYMAAGRLSVDALIADIGLGLFVTEMMGSSVNGLTGDYSRGAAGYLIENGKITVPVSEITIAGNLNDMFRQITPADDLEFKRGTDAPSLRVDGMTIAGR